MKRILSILLLMATLLSAFSITALADDNATGGDGTTHDASDGYGWYNTNEFLWKVTLFVGKSDQVTKQSSLTNDFYRIGTVIMKRPGCTFNSSCVFGNATKVDYYGGTSLSLVTNPYYIDDANVPRIPITHDGNIDTVKSYFGSTGTMNTILNGLAGNQGTTQYGLVKNKTFTIGGVTKSGWSSDYLLPSGTTNRIPWVIVYEPIVKMHLKDRVNTVAFTATEYVISAEYGWYDWYKSGGKGQNVGIVPYRHLPSSVQLEESWFGYPVYPTRNDSYKWSVEEVIKGGGWGMRWLPIAIQEPVNHGKDFSVSIIDYEATPKVGETTSVKIRWENNTATAGTVPVELWMGSSKIWSSEKTLPGKTAVTSTLQLSYATTGTKNMTAKINYDKRSEETNPNNNIASFTVNPYAPAVEIDYGVYFGAVEQPQPNSYADVTVNWKNYKSTGGTVLCELFRDDVLIWSGLKTFTGYQLITQTFSVYYSGSNSRTLTARINYANRDSETDPSDNSRTTSVILSTPLDSTYDFSVSDIAVTPETLYQGGLATVSFISDNWNRDISYDGILVEVLVDGTVVKSESVSFSAYGRNSHSYTVRMEDYGTQTVTARINWTNRFSERNSSNNIDQTSVFIIFSSVYRAPSKQSAMVLRELKRIETILEQIKRSESDDDVYNLIGETQAIYAIVLNEIGGKEVCSYND